MDAARQHEEDLGLALRQAVTEAGDQLAQLTAGKQQLEADHTSAAGRKTQLQQEIASLGTLASEMRAEKVRAS